MVFTVAAHTETPQQTPAGAIPGVHNAASGVTPGLTIAATQTTEPAASATWGGGNQSGPVESGTAPAPAPDADPTGTLSPREWTSWPIAPIPGSRAIEIYKRGLAGGVDPRSFSIIGDCQSEPNVFLGPYDSGRYRLGPGDEGLQETIDQFKGSFGRQSAAVRDGMSAPSALSPLWADPKLCQPNETPVACELRRSNPSIVFIAMGTNWKEGASAESYAGYLRQVVDLVIAHGAVPILATKADNIEGDYSINLATARIAAEYGIPLWNFWRASDDLPGHGLDGARGNGFTYLTPAGWERKGLTGLQALDSVWRGLSAAVEQGDGK